MRVLTDFQNPDGALAEFYEMLPSGVTVPKNLTESADIKEMFRALWGWVSGEDNSFLVSLAFLFGVGLIFFLAETISSPDRLQTTVSHALSLVFGVSVFSVISPLIEGLYEGLTGVFAFFSKVSPFLYAIEISCGKSGCAEGLYLGFQILLWLMEGWLTLFLPILSLLCALCLVSFLSPPTLALADSLKKGLILVLGFEATVFSAVMAFQTFLKSTADKITLRGAKYALSQMVPIIGNTVSSAISSLASALSYVKSTVGAVGIYAVLLLLAPSFLKMLVLRFFLSFMGRFFTFSTKSGVCDRFSSFCGVLDAAIATSFFAFVLYLFSFVLFLLSGVAIAG